MVNRKGVLITSIIALILVVVFFTVTNAITKYTGFSVSKQGNDFEVCLEKKDITLYINTEDVAMTLKNDELYGYLENFKIINCLRNNQVCLDKNIKSFPIWIINSDKIEGSLSLRELVDASRCSLIGELP